MTSLHAARSLSDWTSASPLMRATLLQLLESKPQVSMNDLQCALYGALQRIHPHGNHVGFLRELRQVMHLATYEVMPVLKKALSLAEAVEAHSEGQEQNLSCCFSLRRSQWIEAKGLEPPHLLPRERRLQTPDGKRSLLGTFVLETSYRFNRDRLAREFLASGATFEEIIPDLAEPLPPYLFRHDPSLDLPVWLWVRYHEQAERTDVERFKKLKELLEPFNVRLFYANDGD